MAEKVRIFLIVYFFVADIKDAHALFADGDSLGSQVDFGNAIRSLNQYPTEAEIINMWKNAFLNGQCLIVIIIDTSSRFPSD